MEIFRSLSVLGKVIATILVSFESASTFVTRPYFQKFVGGYVEERRCYLDRRVAAQRQGLGKFQTDGGSSESRIEASPQQKLAAKAEFKVRIHKATRRIAARLKPSVCLSLYVRCLSSLW